MSKKACYCNFCGKSQDEVRKLIAGPAVFVCDECVDMCHEIAHDRPETRSEREVDHTAIDTARAMLKESRARVDEVVAMLSSPDDRRGAAGPGEVVPFTPRTDDDVGFVG